MQIDTKIREAHIIMNRIQNSEINEIAVAMAKDFAYNSKGQDKLKRVLDERMLPILFIKRSQFYQKWRTCEKREYISWDQYIESMKK